MVRPGRPTLQALAVAALFLFPSVVLAQVSSGHTRITQPVDETKLVTLQGNTHPLARPEFDRGAAPDSQPMNRALLVLQRGPDQEGALRKLLDDQQSKSSLSFHQWLTPEQFGQQFGPSDADIATVTTWLESHGFNVNRVSAGRTVIEISGNAGQIRNAFHTEIHNFVVNGESHWANASDPEIPAALAPVVAGFVSLNDFPDESFSQRVGQIVPSANRDQPQLTGECKNSTTGATFACYAVTPYDFAAIYNALPLWSGTGGPVINGTGQAIAIVGQSEICTQFAPGDTFNACGSRDDVLAYRTVFGLSGTGPAVRIFVDGADPGLNSGETEADLDVEIAGAVAPGAQIDLAIAQSTSATQGDRLAAIYIVDTNLAPVLSMSFGNCEAALGAGGNAFFNALWEQAAAQGITVSVSAGDSGAAGCDSPNASTAADGLAVSGIASTPFNVALGGTDFDDAGIQSQYWSNASAPETEQSARDYVPEIPWNNSCAATGAAGCAGLTASSSAVIVEGGGGGKSSLYSKSEWQNGAEITGAPSTDGGRDIPDASLFSAVGSASGASFIICESDVASPAGACSLSGTGFILVGGTSAAAPAFAGIMAMVNQNMASQGLPARQGDANYILYPLATQETYTNCATHGVASGNGCAFYDVTTSNNSVPCGFGSTNCNATSGAIGLLVDSNGNPAWSAGEGYDLATGLGSINVTNLVRAWPAGVGLFTPTGTTLQLCTGTGQSQACVSGGSTSTLSLNYGDRVYVNSTVASTPPGSGTPTGAVALIGTPNSYDLSGSTSGSANPFLLNGAIAYTAGFFQLTAGSTPGASTTALVGSGSLPSASDPYQINAHYGGDGTFGASDSSAINVKVAPQPTTTSFTMFGCTSSLLGSCTVPPPYPYGLPIEYFVQVAGNGTGAANPTGAIVITFADEQENPVTMANGFATTIQDQIFGVGTIPITAAYNDNSSDGLGSGFPVDPNYLSSAAPTQMLTITQNGSAISISPNPATVISGNSLTLTATILPSSPSFGNPPTGTVQFLANGAPISGGASQSGTAGNIASNTVASLTASVTFTPTANTSVTAVYGGSLLYAGSTTAQSVPVTVTSFSLSSANFSAANPVTIPAPGQPATIPFSLMGQNGFANPVSLSCSVAFTGTGTTVLPTCTFVSSGASTASILLNTPSSPQTLVVSTTAASSAAPMSLPVSREPRGWPLNELLATLILTFALLLSFKSFKARRPAYALVALLLLFAAGTFGCGGGGGGASVSGGGNGGGGENGGGGSPGTLAGTYTLTMIASSSGVQQTYTVTIVVQ